MENVAIKARLLSLFAIGCGGFLGAILRYLFSEGCQKLSKNLWFPLGTFSVNIIGCFILGLLGGWSESKQLFSPTFRFIVMIGFLGAFTTFSTFSYETLSLLRDRETLYAFFNVSSNIVVGLFAAWLGLTVSNII
ncbi:MAG: fluoride efflux transporter CrcB [Verrucomicrobiota bacterium]|nr:fluoride efflux transporter CrcB [Verrucomicrobiota bacterium]